MRLAVLLLVAGARAGAEECPSGGPVYVALPGDCSSFQRCEAGRPVPGRCPPGQVFSGVRQRCVDPALLGCGSCIADWCGYKCTCLRADRKRHCPFRLQFAAELALADLALQPHCLPEAGSFSLGSDKLGQVVVRNATATVSMCDVKAGQKTAPHFADCRRGVRCAAVGGEEVPLSCPQGSLYHPGLGRCDQPQLVECATPPHPPGCPRDEVLLSGCRLTCTCEVQRGGCPARLRFAATLAVFHASTQIACFNGSAVIELDEKFSGALSVHANTTLVNHCPYSAERRTVYLPDASDCRKMFRCQHGRETSLTCPGGQHFDPASGRCGGADPAGCRTPAPSPPTPPAADDMPCPASVACPAGSSGRAAVPHPDHCALFCDCDHGSTVLRACPPGQHFSARTRSCDSPLKAGCVTLCHRLAEPAGGMWSRQECNATDSMESEECRLECDEEHQLVGSEVIKCTKNGWLGTGGLGTIPSCKTPQEVAEDIINKINGTLSRMNQTNQDTALLFILDESGSVRTPNFEIEKDFVSALVNAFPLSQERAAGVVSFSRLSAVDISLNETSTCNFLDRLRGIHYSSGRTDIASVLEAAMEEIGTHASNKTTLVFLITDGRSQTDPVAAAQVLRSQDRILFIIGVARYVREQVEPISSTYRDGSKLFFGLPSFTVFKVVADYLKTTYTMGASQECSQHNLNFKQS